MKTLSIIALVLSMMFLVVVANDPSFAATKKVSNDGKNSANNGKHIGNGNSVNANSGKSEPDVEHIINRIYLGLNGTIPMLNNIEFQVEKTTLHLEWTGKANEENTSFNENNFNAEIKDGKGSILFEGVMLAGHPFRNIKISINSIKSGLLNEHGLILGEEYKGYSDIFLRAESMNITIAMIVSGVEMPLIVGFELIHPMIKIQDGELQLSKMDDNGVLAPPRAGSHTQHTTFGKIKSAK